LGGLAIALLDQLFNSWNERKKRTVEQIAAAQLLRREALTDF
jgi:hypothetical protein